MTTSISQTLNKLQISEEKRAIFRSSYAHLYPGRVEKLLSGGIDFIPDKRDGYRYWDKDGRELYDLHLNGGTFNLGHRHPDLVEALTQSLTHWDIGNHHFTSEPKTKLAEALIESCPGDMQYVIFTPSASEANDMAIKAARITTGRKKILALDSAYHGRSGLSGAAGDDDTARYFNSALPNDFVTVPFNDIAAVENALRNREFALVMMEVIPATSGFMMPSDDYFQEVKRLCEKYETLFLADEVQTGLGRSGKIWAIEHWNVEPDILVCGKGLSGGLYPMAALVTREHVGSWMKDNGWGYVSTFGGSDLGCHVAIKALEISTQESTLANVARNANYIRAGLERIKPRFPFFEDIRQKGLIFGLKFSDSSYGYGMMKALYEEGVWAIVAGFDESVLQFKPGLLLKQEECDEILKRFENACIWLVNNFGELITGGGVDENSSEIRAVMDIAKAALNEWGLQGADLELLKHRENSVFKVTIANQDEPYVLRVHRQGYHTDAELDSEFEWMKALDQSGIPCPHPIQTKNQENFAKIFNKEFNETRQCSMINWVEGSPFDYLGRVEKGVVPELKSRYFKLGALAAKLHNQSEIWQPSPIFERDAWDSDGLLGDSPKWGRFWEHPLLTKQQKREILKARFVLKSLLKQIGKTKQNYGLIHADFLPENILNHKGELRLIDFDDCGYGWHMFEMATSLFPQINQPYFDDLMEAYVSGYRTERQFSEEDLEILPAFLMIRGFTYLGWLMTRSQSLPHGDKLATEIANGLCEFIPDLMKELSFVQRTAVNLVCKFSKS